MIVSGLTKSGSFAQKVLKDILMCLKQDFFFKRFREFSVYLGEFNKSDVQKYPVLKIDKENNTFCTSCGLCEKICPTKAIEIKTISLMTMGEPSLTLGEAPHKFILNTTLCTRCSICIDICPVEAMATSTSDFSGEVDLTMSTNPG